MQLSLCWALSGAACGGAVGAILGLGSGIAVYAPTAPFAAVEVGVPGAAVGGGIGLAVGGIVAASRRLKRGP